MLTYKYTARDTATGQKIKAELQAESEQSAAKLLHEQNLIPISLSLKDANGGFGKFGKRVKAKDKILFSRQLSTLINAGLPLLQSLRTVANQTKSKQLSIVINEVMSSIEGGSALSAALAKHPQVFSRIYISLIEAGEASGTLDKALERIAMQQEKDAEILSKVRGAMVYPAIVLLVMGGVVGFMLVKVLPQVEVLYEGFGNAQLPLVTRILLAASKFVRTQWYIVLVIFVVLGFLSGRWIRTLGGRRIFDKLKMKMPPFGPLFMKVYMARFSRTATTLVASGVPLIQVLEITASSINNVHIEASIRAAIEKVKGGRALSESIRGDSNFLDLVPDMLSIGEQSGAIEQMMDKTASYYEKEVDDQIKTVSTIIEPVLMVVLGVMAFIMVAAVLLPVYGLAGQGAIK